MQKLKIDLSAWTVIKIILVILAFYFIFLIRDILALFLVVLILVAALDPIVNRWEKKMPRAPAVALLFLLILLALAAIIYVIAPPVVEQTVQLINHLPEFVGRFSEFRSQLPTIEKNLSGISQSLSGITGGFVSITTGVFGGVFTLLSTLVLTGYFLIDKNAFSKFILSILPAEEKEKITAVFDKIAQKLGGWFRGQIILGAIIAVVDLIGLLIIGVPYALTLAIISGILEIIPTIGPILAGVIAAVVALIDQPIKALFVAILYILTQQLENNIIVPKVMQKAVGLSPVIIIFAILIGAKLLGVIGAILAVPLAASISVVIQEWPALKRLTNK